MSALAAMVAVLAFGATMASTATAALLPLFLTQSRVTLLFTGVGSNPVLHGLQAKIAATVNCQKVLIHGFILHKSELVHLLGLLFENKCTQTIGSTTKECSPLHITTKPILAELGFLSETALKTVVMRLEPSDGTGVFAKFNCGSGETTVGGAVVGEIPEVNANNQNQYNKELTELEVKFETNPVGTDQQKITTIFLLGEEMTKQELTVEGLFGEKAAQEANAILTADGGVTIHT